MHALGSTHLALCTWLYALGSMHGSIWLHASWLYVFDSAQVTLCKLVRELRAEEPFAMLSGKTHPNLARWLFCSSQQATARCNASFAQHMHGRSFHVWLPHKFPIFRHTHGLEHSLLSGLIARLVRQFLSGMSSLRLRSLLGCLV